LGAGSITLWDNFVKDFFKKFPQDRPYEEKHNAVQGYQNKTLLETMCGGKFLKKDENEGWEIYEDLAQKTLQWEPTNEESRTPNPRSSKEVSIR